MRAAVTYSSLSIRTVFFFLLVTIAGQDVFSQGIKPIFSENEFSVAISTSSSWSYSFGIANRALLMERGDDLEEVRYAGEHLELNHFTSYSTGENSEASLGLRYRFRDLFHEENADEFRMIQEFSASSENLFIGWSHRGRFEQRFRNQETIFRLRYQFGLSKPITRKTSFELATEALYSMSPQSKPEHEQRVEVGFENTSLQNWEFSFSLEYRMENYLQDRQQNELFILTGATLNL